MLLDPTNIRDKKEKMYDDESVIAYLNHLFQFPVCFDQSTSWARLLAFTGKIQHNLEYHRLPPATLLVLQLIMLSRSPILQVSD